MLFYYSFRFALCAWLCCHRLPWPTHERLWLHLPLRCWGFSSYSPGPGQNLVLLVCPPLALLPVFPILVMRPHSTTWPSRILDITLGISPVLPIPVTSFLNLNHVLPFLFLPFLLWFLLYQLSPWPLLSPYCCSVTPLCLTLCNPMNCSMPGFPVLHCLLEFAQLMSIESVMPSNPSHLLSSPSSPAS